MGFREAMGLILPYSWKRILDQIKSVWIIILYLVAFQILVLGVPVAQASIIAIGIFLVIFGLAFFMEGLFLGLMPLGDLIGFKLPQKAKLPVILLFGFILGVLATFAEPAIGVLKSAGASVKAWDAPLLYLIVNKYSNYLVYAVGAGVGIAVLMGLLRFMYSWSLKPFIYVLVAVLSGLSIWANFHPNLVYISGLAWDCGGVTTGPVTVPLVLAIGLGICRMVGSADSGAAGFGVVTLASAFPVLTVLILGMVLMGTVPNPSRPETFFAPDNRAKAVGVFNSEEELIGYAALQGGSSGLDAAFGNDPAKRQAFLKSLVASPATRVKAFGTDPAFQKWVGTYGTPQEKALLAGMAGSLSGTAVAATGGWSWWKELIVRNSMAAVQAILLLMGFLLIAFLVLIRERLPRLDEIILGIFFAILGMSLFNVGIELGLTNLGNQVGSKLPTSFKSIDVVENAKTIPSFDPKIVQTALVTTPTGVAQEQFFYAKVGTRYQSVPYDPARYDSNTSTYQWMPKRGPLFGSEGGLLGILVVLAFAFVMGYGATLAEPALNALGITVEELTVGTFKKSLLMQAVAIGVGVGLALGVAKIVWNLPLVWLLVPPYAVLLLITAFSTEEFVNIGWDSAGVTTGPITVPLVLAMGLGISSQTGAVEGFGILATASVCPILSVLTVGLFVGRKAKKAAAAIAA
ncbi:MAG: DUF1538 domain-containing protein [Spirochaetes bacterium]|nr:DUF1538 domain-containing protein [Spirochaetota bacterium]